MKNRRVILQESVLTRLINKAILNGEVFISSEGRIMISETEQDSEKLSFRTSNSLPSIPRVKDVVTQTELNASDSNLNKLRLPRTGSGVTVVTIGNSKHFSKSKPAPPPPPASKHISRSVPCIPPPPPSRSPPPLERYCENPISFSYGYTSPVTTIHDDSSFYTLSPQSTPRRKKYRAPNPPSSSTEDEVDNAGDLKYGDSLAYDTANITIYTVSSRDEDDCKECTLSPGTRPGTPRVVTPRSECQDWSSCNTGVTINYSIFSLTRPPSFLYKFRRTVEDLDIEKILGIRDVYLRTIMRSTYKNDIFYTREQIEKAVTSAYPDIHREILSDYKDDKLHRVLRCCYDNLSGEIVLPCKVIMDYITPVNAIDELVFVSRSDITKHLTLPDTVEKLILVTDVNKTTSVDPQYIEFATQESTFLAMVKKKVPE